MDGRNVDIEMVPPLLVSNKNKRHSNLKHASPIIPKRLNSLVGQIQLMDCLKN
jgi:hypothetical protein